MPALVPAVTTGDGGLQGVHRTWLDLRRQAKARVSRPRKAPGRIHGLAVRLGDPRSASTLLVGEDIETVLSLITVLPGAAPLSAAALRLQLRCTRLGVPTAVLLPAGNDFNDNLLARGPGSLAIRLAALVTDRRRINRSGFAAGDERKKNGS